MHHHQSVSAAYVHDIRGKNFLPHLLFRGLFLDEKEDISLAFQESAKVFLDVHPIELRIGGRSRNKQKFWILLPREPDNLSINGKSSPGSDSSATDGNDRLSHCFILASK